MAKQLADNPADPKIGTLIEEMLKRTRNGGALTQQLLAFSRRQSLEPEKVDLNQHIGSLTALLERTLGRDIRIERHLDPALGPVLIDANQLDVAILNLAVNARHAMTDYGRFTIETSDAPDDLDDLKGLAASFVRLTLSDTGHGMDKQVLAQVFEPFFTTKSNGEGTGLGLSQVYGFVKQSGGHIRIDSQVGKRTSVHLFLPRTPRRDP